MRVRLFVLVLLLGLLASLTRANRFLPLSTAARKFQASTLPNGLLRSIPALNKRAFKNSSLGKTVRVATKKRKKRTWTQDVPRALSNLPLPDISSTGLYYGLDPKTITKAVRPDKKNRTPSIKDTLMESLEELKSMRKEMEALRREMSDMKRQMAGEEVGGEEEEGPMEAPREKKGVTSLLARRKRQQRFEKVAREVEQWADQIMFQQDGEADGWKQVKPNKAFADTFNKNGQTRVYLKWMKDSRGKYADTDDDRVYPCIKVYTTVDAPLEDVCYYLASEEHAREYNVLLEGNRDLEEISPHSKVVASWTPQILFVKPRMFSTFCSHRWRRDDTQVVVNQAYDHRELDKDDMPRAYAIRGANFIGRDPDDPEKTRIAVIAHTNAGNDVPKWAIRTAVNTLAPIEPFRLFYNINEGARKVRSEMERSMDVMEMVSTPGGRSNRPAGLAQLGYACFWPAGGGEQEEAPRISVDSPAEGDSTAERSDSLPTQQAGSETGDEQSIRPTEEVPALAAETSSEPPDRPPEEVPRSDAEPSSEQPIPEPVAG